MTHLGFVRLFSAPLTAFLVSAIIVSACGYLFYRTGTAKRAAAAANYWKLLALASEICVAVGLIGLATFAGRMKISADHQILDERVRMAETTVGEHLRLAALENCAPAGRRALAPYNPGVAKKELCAISTAYAGASPSADWETAGRSLREFSSKYPGCVENVFTRHSDCSETVAAATQLADDIDALEAAKRVSRNDEAMSAILEKPNSWKFLLLAFFIAAIGVSIKCARAAADYLPERQSR
ncbi:MAG TPA: hypothetical protein VFS02_22160 [Telluria sp.]|nr:hypothetical protein [Telluria sp.]